MNLKQTATILWIATLGAGLVGCASVGKKSKLAPGEMRFVVAEASGGG